MADRNQKNNGPSWLLIILMFFLFFPLAFVLLFMKLTADKPGFNSKRTIYNLCGWLLSGSGILGYIGVVTRSQTEESSTQIVVFAICICGGLLLIGKAAKMKKTDKLYQRYVTIVGKNYITSIDDIAGTINLDYNKTVKDLQKMIAINYFGDGYINIAQHELVLPYRQHLDNTTQQSNDYNQQVVAVPIKKVVNCNSCGANNSVTVGVISECEFCGSPIAAS